MTNPAHEDEAFFKDRGFGMTIGFGTRPAVMSIDLMNGFTDATMPLGSNLDTEIEAALRVLGAARDKGVPVLHTIVRYDDEDMRDAGVWQLKQAGTTSLRAGTRAVEIDDRIGRLPNEQLIVKKFASSFFGTDLVSRLNSLNVDTVILVGCTTSGCIRATAVDAVQYGFRPMVVREAVGDRSESAHTQSLFDLGQKYADIVEVDETVEYLAKL